MSKPSEEVLVNWARDPDNGRCMCTPEHPMPSGVGGHWTHAGAEVVGECYEGCCDDFKCKDCGATWRVEYS